MVLRCWGARGGELFWARSWWNSLACRRDVGVQGTCRAQALNFDVGSRGSHSAGCDPGLETGP